MTLSELKSGMMVEMRHGGRYIVFRDTGLDGNNSDAFVHPYERSMFHGWMSFSSYHEDMTCWCTGDDDLFDDGSFLYPSPQFDIVKVFRPRSVNVIGKEEYCELVYERDEK